MGKESKQFALLLVAVLICLIAGAIQPNADMGLPKSGPSDAGTQVLQRDRRNVESHPPISPSFRWENRFCPPVCRA